MVDMCNEALSAPVVSEPTEEMLEAGLKAFHESNRHLPACSDRELVARIYEAMSLAKRNADTE